MSAMSAMSVSAVSVCVGPIGYAGSVCYVYSVCMGMPYRLCIVYLIKGYVDSVSNVCYVECVYIGMS